MLASAELQARVVIQLGYRLGIKLTCQIEERALNQAKCITSVTKITNSHSVYRCVLLCFNNPLLRTRREAKVQRHADSDI